MKDELLNVPIDNATICFAHLEWNTEIPLYRDKCTARAIYVNSDRAGDRLFIVRGDIWNTFECLVLEA